MGPVRWMASKCNGVTCEAEIGCIQTNVNASNIIDHEVPEPVASSLRWRSTSRILVWALVLVVSTARSPPFAQSRAKAGRLVATETVSRSIIPNLSPSFPLSRTSQRTESHGDTLTRSSSLPKSEVDFLPRPSRCSRVVAPLYPIDTLPHFLVAVMADLVALRTVASRINSLRLHLLLFRTLHHRTIPLTLRAMALAPHLIVKVLWIRRGVSRGVEPRFPSASARGTTSEVGFETEGIVVATERCRLHPTLAVPTVRLGSRTTTSASIIAEGLVVFLLPSSVTILEWDLRPLNAETTSTDVALLPLLWIIVVATIEQARPLTAARPHTLISSPWRTPVTSSSSESAKLRIGSEIRALQLGSTTHEWTRKAHHYHLSPRHRSALVSLSGSVTRHPLSSSSSLRTHHPSAGTRRPRLSCDECQVARLARLLVSSCLL